MAVPNDPVCITFNDGQDEAERQIKLLCTRLLPGWAHLATTDMQVSGISGGISNLLVKVEPPPPLRAVAVKVFGDKTELLIDRAAEKQLLLRLNAVGFGAPVLGLFHNGRIELFLTAKTLTPEEMCDPRFIPHIARRLRAFHDLHFGDVAAPAAVATDALAAAAEAQHSAAAAAAGAAPPTPTPLPSASSSSQWEAMFGWLAMAESLTFPHDPAKQAAYDKVDFAAMRTELTALRGICDRVASPRVLCHNDLLSGNILVVQPPQEPAAVSSSSAEASVSEQEPEQGGRRGAEGAAASSSAPVGGAGSAGAADGDDVLQGGELQFIDFEYSCNGPRGFDWGNHFNEYAGFDCVYDRFPSAEQQKAFFRHYLQPGELRLLAQEQPSPSSGPAADEAAALEAAEEVVLERLVSEACVFALASHAYWGVWSFIQARYSPISFDYLDYSRMRWAEYYRRKEEFFALVDRLFPQ